VCAYVISNRLKRSICTPVFVRAHCSNSRKLRYHFFVFFVYLFIFTDTLREHKILLRLSDSFCSLFSAGRVKRSNRSAVYNTIVHSCRNIHTRLFSLWSPRVVEKINKYDFVWHAWYNYLYLDVPVPVGCFLFFFFRFLGRTHTHTHTPRY